MILQGIIFYIFATVAVAGGVMVVAARNPVHSVLFLILTFFTTAALFVLIGAEFLAMVLVVVYVGAVAVLFLFVVMMLDINFVEMREGFLQYMPIGVLVGVILLVELLMVLGTVSLSPEVLATGTEPIPDLTQRQNIAAIGDVIYTKYIYAFQAAGMILLIAMVGAIVLTLRQRPGVRKQKVADQLARRREDSVELKKVQPGQGI
jgi:NADH-quinone oxidoreductase subunit J